MKQEEVKRQLGSICKNIDTQIYFDVAGVPAIVISKPSESIISDHCLNIDSIKAEWSTIIDVIKSHNVVFGLTSKNKLIAIMYRHPDYIWPGDKYLKK